MPVIGDGRIDRLDALARDYLARVLGELQAQGELAKHPPDARLNVARKLAVGSLMREAASDAPDILAHEFATLISAQTGGDADPRPWFEDIVGRAAAYYGAVAPIARGERR